jgi:hypothetical protein
MKTVYTDRYAVTVWLPGLFGLGQILLAMDSAPFSWGKFLFGLGSLVIAGFAWLRRRSMQEGGGHG